MNETNLSLKYLIDQLHKEQTLPKEEWITLIEGHTPELSEYLFSLAREERHRYYGHDVYVRGLIEFTNYCKYNCYFRNSKDLCYIFNSITVRVSEVFGMS